MERTNKVKTLKLRRLRKVGTSQRVDTSDDTLMEDVSNQGRIIDELDKDKGVVLMNEKEEIEESKLLFLLPDKKEEWLSRIQMRNHLQKLLLKPRPRIKEKKRPQTEAQARRNMMMYLKNAAGFILDYFKGMSYDDIHPIFENKFNANMEFILKLKEQIEEETNRTIKGINQTPAQKAVKRKRLNEEGKDVEKLKRHLEIVPDEDDDVYTEATPLARKVSVVDYQIVHFNNEPHYKIIRANVTHQLVMFRRPDGQDQILEELKKCLWSSNG
nr:hypothetical protein [Tanacetum cinerariifolium]